MDGGVVAAVEAEVCRRYESHKSGRRSSTCAHLLDPELPRSSGPSRCRRSTPKAWRPCVARFPAPGFSDAVVRTEYVVPRDPPVPVRVHRPAENDEEILPAIFTIHGGRYVLGSYAMDHSCTTRWGPALGTAGVSVEYRLSPDMPYPGPLEDCYAALRWTFEHANDLGVDHDRIGVYGLSAGGGLAAASPRWPATGAGPARLPTPRLPHARRPPGHVSRSATAGLYVWDATSNQFGWRSHLGDSLRIRRCPALRRRRPGHGLAGLPLRAVSSSDRSTDSETRTWTTRCGSIRPASPCELHVIVGLATRLPDGARSGPGGAAWPRSARTIGSAVS